MKNLTPDNNYFLPKKKIRKRSKKKNRNKK